MGSQQSFQLFTTAIMKQLTEAGISCTTLNPKAKLNYIGDDEVTLGTDEDSVAMISDGDVRACIEGL